MGYAVAQLVDALVYKSAGRGFYSRRDHWDFSTTLSLRPYCGPGVDSASKRNEYHLSNESSRREWISKAEIHAFLVS
jgi:hypothetical protein